jgi:transcriptional regulator with XRE-family HTH domain
MRKLKQPQTGSFAERVKFLREEKSLRASDLAKLANVSPATVWHWEHNGMIPRQATVTAIASKLGVTEQYLMTGAKGATDNLPRIRDAATIAPCAEIAGASLETLIRAIEDKGFSVTIHSKR